MSTQDCAKAVAGLNFIMAISRLAGERERRWISFLRDSIGGDIWYVFLSVPLIADGVWLSALLIAGAVSNDILTAPKKADEIRQTGRAFLQRIEGIAAQIGLASHGGFARIVFSGEKAPAEAPNDAALEEIFRQIRTGKETEITLFRKMVARAASAGYIAQ